MDQSEFNFNLVISLLSEIEEVPGFIAFLHEEELELMGKFEDC
jgi:hypothetical protein